jgi:hypothetical protein
MGADCSPPWTWGLRVGVSLAPERATAKQGQGLEVEPRRDNTFLDRPVRQRPAESRLIGCLTAEAIKEEIVESDRLRWAHTRRRLV